MNAEAWIILAVGLAGWGGSILCFLFGCRFGREHAIRQLADEMHGEIQEHL